MWLSKLLGGHPADDSEPAKFPPHPASSTAASVNAVRQPARSPGIRPRATTRTKGFDPYNSGVFRKTSAWERVGKR